MVRRSIVTAGLSYLGNTDALAQNVFLPIADCGEQYGLHPALARIQVRCNQGKVSAVLNVG